GFMAYDLIDGYAVSMNGVPELLRQRRGLLEWRANNPHYRRGSIVPVFHPTEPWITEAMTYRGMEIARAALPDASTAIMWANPAQEGVEASQFTLQLWGLLWDQTWERKAGA
ncbi:MAG: hypothetical protein EBR82_26385, partial [Caulobacteraceae bacterium]|nr:hypothetical protein [Caulobacteraceae bacterium]